MTAVAASFIVALLVVVAVSRLAEIAADGVARVRRVSSRSGVAAGIDPARELVSL